MYETSPADIDRECLETADGPAREPAIERETINLRREAERCLKNVERLKKRLTPVIVAYPPAGEPKTKEPESSTPLGNAVRGSRALIENANATLEGMLSSLEI